MNGNDTSVHALVDKWLGSSFSVTGTERGVSFLLPTSSRSLGLSRRYADFRFQAFASAPRAPRSSSSQSRHSTRSSCR